MALTLALSQRERELMALTLALFDGEREAT